MLEYDVHLFGAFLYTTCAFSGLEPPSQKIPHKKSLQIFCGDPGLAHRQGQSAEPKIQRLLRAERVNRVALDEYLSRHGRECASAEFLPSGPPPKVFSAG